jgi:hypothetical protein
MGARYLITVAVVATALLFGCMATLSVKFWGYRDLNRLDGTVGQVTRLAEEKLGAADLSKLDTIFIGDSSLGYGLDPAEFDRLAGTRSLSLPLTGAHGLPAALVLLRRIADRTSKPLNIVLYLSVDGLAWGENLDGRFYMSSWPFERALSAEAQARLLQVYLYRLIDGREALSFILDRVRGIDHAVPTQEEREWGYFKSSGKFDPSRPENASYHIRPSIPQGTSAWISAIGGLCASHGLNCLFVTGPLFSGVIHHDPAERGYLDASRAIVEGAGLRMVNSDPIPVSFDDRGDSLFHVAWDKRGKFTAIYCSLIVPFLRKDPGELVRP